jgi:hypothetical protein
VRGLPHDQPGERKPDKTCEASGCHADDNKHGSRFSAFGGDPPNCATCHLSSTSWVKGATNFNHDRRTKFKLTGRHDQIACRSCHRGRTAADFEQFDPSSVGCRGCHEHRNVHPKEKHPDSKCLTCHEGAGKVNLKAGAVDAFHGPQSNFPLVKGHKPVKCAQCHPKDSFSDTPAECGARCHEDGLHKGSLGDTCSRCHSPGVWDAVRFDHADDTKWPLEGLHAKIAECTDCHPKRQYTDTPTTCSADGCHAKDDVHKGRLGKGCDRCHKVTGDNIFNHNTMSSFALTGKHLDVRCAECHTSQTFKPRPQNCFGCHPEPDLHRGQYGTACESCHSTVDWNDIKPLHDVGGFALIGAHDNLACARCHKDSRPMAGSGNLCINCHRQDDIHQNALTPRCGECHTQVSFAPARFDHTTVGCNLTGAAPHARVQRLPSGRQLRRDHRRVRGLSPRRRDRRRWGRRGAAPDGLGLRHLPQHVGLAPRQRRWPGVDLPVRAAVLLSLVALAGAARAEPTEPDRFFADKPDGDRDKSLWQGSLVLSSFGYAETSDQLELGLIEVPLASPYRRVWGEARLQLDGRHLKGGRWDARVDGRARYVASRPGDASGDPNRIQSGLLGANEYDVRELYLVRAGKRSDLFLGRLVIADLGALRVDGMRLDYAKNARWTYLGFLGLHPAAARGRWPPTTRSASTR